MVLVAQLEEQQPGRRRRRAPKPVRDPIWTADGLRVSEGAAAAAAPHDQEALQSGLRRADAAESLPSGDSIAPQHLQCSDLMSRLQCSSGFTSLRLQRPSGCVAGLLPALLFTFTWMQTAAT